MVQGVGGSCRSYDLKTGYDFTKPQTRDDVARELRENPPDLLVLCPPCTDEGGWFHLNACTMDPQEYMRRVRQSRMFVKFCCKLFEQQIALGGQAIFEHPLGSKIWSYDEVKRLCDQHHLLTCHMCRYGLRIPRSVHLIRKGTKLLVSHASMKCLAKQCPGSKSPQHQCHQPVAGSHPEVGSISAFTGKYTPQFVEAVMDTVPRFVSMKKACLVEDVEWSTHHVQEVLAAKPDLSSEKTDAELLKVLDKVHRNLGHPPAHDLVRILKHAQASDRAISLAPKLDCAFCKSQIRPHVPLPAKASRPSTFNQCIGVDVKYLPGWKPNQQIKAVNIVDQSSCYQLMIPIFERETSMVLKQVISEHWVKVFGPPKEVVLDQAQTNLGDPLRTYLEFQGCHVHAIAGEAHWQLGKTERHGGWFCRILEKTLAEFPPSDRSDWEACVTHAHVKNAMIQSHGYTPYQHVFGRNPDVPTDLLSEPLHVVPATASLTDDSMAKSQAIRSAARLAVIKTQDDNALRRAYSARPRLAQQFQAGDLVAYWRCQKYQQGQVLLGGRWYGTAVVVGNVGKNYVIAHRRQIFRAAPEQLRPATEEERAVVTTPQAELLGIKDMIEGGTFRSHQFIDLVPGHYPTMAEPVLGPPTAESQSDGLPAPSASARSSNAPEPPVPSTNSEAPVPAQPEPSASEMPDKSPEEDQNEVAEQSSSASADSSYGPLRRVRLKAGPPALYRPPSMKEADFAEIMREIVPKLVERAIVDETHDESMHAKRQLEDADVSEQPASQKPRVEEHETLSVEDVNHLQELWDDNHSSVEVLIANYMQKKLSKEIHPTKNSPELQAKVDESKRVEWQTILDKQAVKIHYGRKAAKIREQHANRFIGSRFVITKKAAEEDKPIDESDPNSYRVKSRWCLQGHLDPDLDKKVAAGMLQSPTLSQMGRMLVMQVVSSFGWQLQLGDIKGAFLEAGPLPEEFTPLFAHPPQGGIPGL